MPKVGDKHFSYSAKGKKAAQAHADKTGQEVNKYEAGGSVDPFSTKSANTLEALTEDNGTMATIPGVKGADPIPAENAQQRTEKFAMGGEVGTGVYAEGGEVARQQKSVDQKNKFKSQKGGIGGAKVKSSGLGKQGEAKKKSEKDFKELTPFGLKFKKEVS